MLQMACKYDAEHWKCCKLLANKMAPGAAWQSVPFGGVGIRSMELCIYIYMISLSVEAI